jgi:hypothetical protein
MIIMTSIRKLGSIYHPAKHNKPLPVLEGDYFN